MNEQIKALWARVNAENYDMECLIKQIDKFERTFSETIVSADERALISLFRTVADRLEDVKNEIDYYNSPIALEGQICKTRSGRYEVCGKELTCGCLLEFLDETEWVKSRIEHNSTDYYALHYHGSLDGLVVRIRDKTR